MPLQLIHALALIKKAAARVNCRSRTIARSDCRTDRAGGREVLAGQHDDQFPLPIWQTGSGTQSNMNVNEVIAGRANELAGAGRGGKSPVHPNDHVNLAQSSNDSFPSAMHMAVTAVLDSALLPALRNLGEGLGQLAEEHAQLVKIERTHLMDATPLTFDPELSLSVYPAGACRRPALLQSQSLLLARAVPPGKTDWSVKALPAVAAVARYIRPTFVSAPNKVRRARRT